MIEIISLSEANYRAWRVYLLFPLLNDNALIFEAGTVLTPLLIRLGAEVCAPCCTVTQLRNYYLYKN